MKHLMSEFNKEIKYSTAQLVDMWSTNMLMKQNILTPPPWNQASLSSLEMSDLDGDDCFLDGIEDNSLCNGI